MEPHHQSDIWGGNYIEKTKKIIKMRATIRQCQKSIVFMRIKFEEKKCPQN